MTACICGRPIVPGMRLPWVHAVNPGRDHHYAVPASRPAPDDLAAASAVRSRDERTPTRTPREPSAGRKGTPPLRAT